MAELVRRTVREELAGRFILTHPMTVRDGLRAGRIRDAGATTPSRLAGLALELDATRFLSVTLHQAVEGAIPIITLSAQSFEAGENRLSWAGFRSASGLDERKMLGLGVIENLDDLARRTTRRLMEDFLKPETGRTGRIKVPTPKEGTYLRSMLNTRTMSKMAVLPFDSVVNRQPQAAAEMATAALMAVLHRKGAPLTHPGIVDETLRRRYEQRYGGLDELSRAALKIGGGARWFITGTVETLEMKGGIEPVPWIALGVRVVDVETGQIFWIGGLERTGEEEENVFGLDRVHSPGELLDGMLDGISAAFLRTVEVERDGSK
ncbi:MAG: hypothetical protein IFK94_02545 [Acidobacteria bacterium]|uniref:Uncharacterized protein n=1 Tax=Candidatus Polarisedimenticola svalbardensis TaxID=2886004 RepID=A0A8J6XSG2_9BACT|nr:hypothetical protein [Candidatus Polarisedimenticola svalbardensis]